jgi:2-methylcitrate dehydratase PrpD
MAQNGLKGVSAPFVGEDGFARTYLHGRFDPVRADPRSRSGVRNGPVVDQALSLVSAHASGRKRGARVASQIGRSSDAGRASEDLHGPQAHDVVGRAVPFRLQPTRWLDAQFSVFWTVAVALCHGAVTPKHLLDEVPPGGEVQAWIARLRAESMEGAARDVGACVLEAIGPFGTVRVEASEAKGHPDNPLTAAELQQKFVANVGLAGIDSSRAADLAGELLALGSSTDVSCVLERTGASAGTFADQGALNVFVGA